MAIAPENVMKVGRAGARHLSIRASGEPRGKSNDLLSGSGV